MSNRLNSIKKWWFDTTHAMVSTNSSPHMVKVRESDFVYLLNLAEAQRRAYQRGRAEAFTEAAEMIMGAMYTLPERIAGKLRQKAKEEKDG